MEILVAKKIITQKYMNKQDAIIYFGYSGHEALFQKMLAEFKNNSDFKKGYRLASNKFPLIDIEKFDEFITWREVNKYKRK